MALEQAALFDDLFFFSENFAYLLSIEPASFDDDLGEDIFGLGESQTLRGMNQLFTTVIVEFQPHRIRFVKIAQNFVEQSVQLLRSGKRKVEHRNFFFD